MSAKKDFQNTSEELIDGSQAIKKIKLDNEETKINLVPENSKTTDFTLPTNSQEQTLESAQPEEVGANPESKTLKVSKKKQKATSTSVGEVLKKEYVNDPNSYVDTYQSLKYKDHMYNVNDDLLIRNESDPNNDFVCKLTRIIRPLNLDSSKALAFLEVQWYYKKADLPKKYAGYLSSISENEVFLTNQKDFVMVDCINSLGHVLTYEDYDKLSKIQPNTFFCRAKFDVNKKKMYPPIERWEKHCICKTPLNPDYMYIQCDQCGMWYHIKCLGLSGEEAETLETYICNPCKQKGKPSEGVDTKNTTQENITDSLLDAAANMPDGTNPSIAQNSGEKISSGIESNKNIAINQSKAAQGKNDNQK